MLRILGIYGAGGLGREVLELAQIINRRKKRWDKILFVIDGDGGDTINGTQVENYETAKNKYIDQMEISLAIGEPVIRNRLIQKVRADNIPLATLIHPDAYIPETVVIGKGVTIQYGCFISCNVRIEDGVYIQSIVGIGHDDVLKEGCIISGMVALAGHVTIGNYAYIGPGVCIKEDLTVGDWSIAGMGAVVFKDIPKEVLVLGNPARPMRKNEERCVFR